MTLSLPSGKRLPTGCKLPEKPERGVADGLEPLRERYEYLMNNKDYLQKVYADSAEKAAYLASKMLSKVQKKIGFIKK